MSVLVSSFYIFLMFSCVGDDRELRALEWRHWRMAAGKLTLQNSCRHCGLIDINLKSFVFYLMSFRNVWHTLGTIWENRPLLQTKKKKMWVPCAFFWGCFCVMTDLSDTFSFPSLTMCCWPHPPLSLPPVAIWGGSVPCVSGLHRGEHAAVTDETRETKNL